MRKIFLIVGTAILIFMAFSAYSVRKEIQGRAQLATIKDMYFPLLQRLDANIVRLDKIQELYIQVVITGDRATIAKAADLGAEADAAFDEIGTLYRGHGSEISRLRADLKSYQELATRASLAFLSADRDAAAPIAAQMNRALADVGARLKSFRQVSYDDFVQTLAGSQRDAEVRLYMGLALGLMNLGFMVVLVYFIRKNLQMMSVIELQNSTLEQRVAERTAQLSQKTSDINAMLQNMKLGVSTVVHGNRIHPEYSNYLRTIFSVDDLAERDLVECLFGNSSLGVDVRDQIAVTLQAVLGEDPMIFDFNSHLLPREMQITAAGGIQKSIQMDWSPIASEHGTVDKVLLITQDVTQLRELEANAAQQKDDLEIIAKILRVSIGRFNEFLQSAEAFLAANRQIITGTSEQTAECVATLFRNMHTIKGNARTFEFSHITNAAHCAEQGYDQLRKNPHVPWVPGAMLEELAAVEAAVLRYRDINENKLGRKGRTTDLLTARGSFVSQEQLADLRKLAATLGPVEAQGTMAELRSRIDRLGLIDLERLATGSADSLWSLAKELRKPAPAVEIINGEIAFTGKFAEALKSCFMHILRNSLDHGIEAPGDRVMGDKPSQGRIRIAAERVGDGVRLRVGDDGRGLALDRLYEKGVAAGLFRRGEQPTRAATCDVIFSSGVSTAERLTEISGRGVGLEAVRTFLSEQGATIGIELAHPEGRDLGLAPFEFVIDVPASACAY